MNLDELWSQLEERVQPGRTGRQLQRILPDSRADLMAAFIAPARRRSIMLTVAAAALDDDVEMPTARGVEVIVSRAQSAARTTLELLLIDDSLSDVFTPLATDVATATAAAASDHEAVQAWRGRLARWQRLLQRSPRGMSGERQRGLFGELWFLTERLGDAVGPEEAVASWTGPDGATHDYQTLSGAVEVKTSAANEPQVARINGERQLDDRAVPALHLLHLSLEVRRDAGRTLLDAVRDARALVASGAASTLLEDRLLAYGFADAHAQHYRHTGYTLRDIGAYRVSGEFPRITESQLPEGLGRVHYDLAIAACASFAVTEDAMLATLKGLVGT